MQKGQIARQWRSAYAGVQWHALGDWDNLVQKGQWLAQWRAAGAQWRAAGSQWHALGDWDNLVQKGQIARQWRALARSGACWVIGTI